MPSIVKMGKVKEKTPPWYESTLLECAVCECRFMLNREDFRSPDNPDAHWVNYRDRRVDGEWTLSGPCPCCGLPMIIDMRRVIREGESLLPPTDPLHVTVCSGTRQRVSGKEAGDDTR